jgi:hypothetical protein
LTLEESRVHAWDILTPTKVIKTTSFKLIGESLENSTYDLLTIQNTLASLDKDGLNYFKGNFKYRGRYTELVTDVFMTIIHEVKITLEEYGKNKIAEELLKNKCQMKEVMIK